MHKIIKKKKKSSFFLGTNYFAIFSSIWNFHFLSGTSCFSILMFISIHIPACYRIFVLVKNMSVSKNLKSELNNFHFIVSFLVLTTYKSIDHSILNLWFDINRNMIPWIVYWLLSNIRLINKIHIVIILCKLVDRRFNFINVRTTERMSTYTLFNIKIY